MIAHVYRNRGWRQGGCSSYLFRLVQICVILSPTFSASLFKSNNYSSPTISTYKVTSSAYEL